MHFHLLLVTVIENLCHSDSSLLEYWEAHLGEKVYIISSVRVHV